MATRWERRSLVRPGPHTAQKKVVIRHSGGRWSNLTRWLPAIVIVRKREFVLDDDFSILIEDLRRAGKRFIVRQNARRQRALFVEEQ